MSLIEHVSVWKFLIVIGSPRATCYVIGLLSRECLITAIQLQFSKPQDLILNGSLFATMKYM